MKETDQQSDIGEIIRRLRGGKETPYETPLARMSPAQVDLTSEAPPQHISPPPSADTGKIQYQKELDVLREERALQNKRVETTILEKELASYRKKEAALLAENESLRKDFQALAEKGNESFATHVKLFEEKLLLLASEKESALKEVEKLQTCLDDTQRQLEEKTSYLKEIEEKLSLESKNLMGRSLEVVELSKEKEKLSQREEALLTQISLLNGALDEEKHHKEIIALSVKTNQEHIAELRSELEHLHGILQEKENKILFLQREKEKADARAGEVEELLALKLASITELEEELAAACARVEELETKSMTQENRIAKLAETNSKQEASLLSVQEEADGFKTRLGRANDYIVEMRDRLESLDRIKNIMTEAAPHVHALSTLFGPTPQSLPSLRNLVESFVVKTSEKGFSLGTEERIEQPELF